jgi:hypothetical protein
MCWVLLIAAIVLICVFLRKVTEKQNKTILIVVLAIMVLFEVLKQIAQNRDMGSWRTDFSGETVTRDDNFRWDAIPFVPCSIFIYSLIVLLFTRMEGWFKESMYLFIAAFGIFSGLTAYLIPNDVLNTNDGIILIQTMLHHGLLIALGVYLFVSGRAKFSHKRFWTGATGIFVAFCLLGLVFNIVMHFIIPTVNINAMYVSPYVDCALPLVSMISGVVPWIVWVLLYIGGYSTASYLVMLAAIGIRKLYRKIKKLPPETATQDKKETATAAKVIAE